MLSCTCGRRFIHLGAYPYLMCGLCYAGTGEKYEKSPGVTDPVSVPAVVLDKPSAYSVANSNTDTRADTNTRAHPYSHAHPRTYTYPNTRPHPDPYPYANTGPVPELPRVLYRKWRESQSGRGSGVEGKSVSGGR